MRIFTAPETINIENSCVTIGNFDGVHKGHQYLLNQVRTYAGQAGLRSVVVTFDPHPLRVLKGIKQPPFITLTKQKLGLIEKAGIDAVFCINFTREMANLTPEKFVETYLVNALSMRHLIIGYDYAFGKNRSGNFQTLQELGEKFGYTVQQSRPFAYNGGAVSSTRIREMIEAGQVFEARELLGRFYRVEGQVVHGQNRGGRLLGFPTANLCLTDELFPLPGVYAVFAEYENMVMPAVANIGFNPTFGNDVLSVEVHIPNFSADMYGKQLYVHFVRNLRPEKKFGGLDELKQQIQADIDQAQKILASDDTETKKFLWTTDYLGRAS